MIFIYEPQEQIPTECLEDYKICYPIRDATNQFNFLSKLEPATINKIVEIYFLHPKGTDLKLYENTISNYYPEVDRYKDPDLLKKIFELTLLPKLSRINDETIRLKLTKLIRDQIFIDESSNLYSSLNSSHASDLLIYLPYKGILTEKLISKTKNSRLVLYSNTSNMQLKEGGSVVEVDPKLYLLINKKLEIINQRDIKVFDAKSYNFEPKSILQLFENSLLNKLNFIARDGIKRMQINGEERLLALKAINHILCSRVPIYYNLLSGVPSLRSSSEPLVFFNFDSLKEPEDEKKLYQLTKNIDFDNYVILQTIQKKISQYFNDYENVELPNQNTIANLITQLFVALLREKNLLTSDYHKLISLLNNNAFNVLFNSTPQLEHLEKTISKLGHITPDDLSHNTELWYFIITEIEMLQKGVKNQQYKRKKQITFAYNFNEWEVTGLGKPIHFPYAKSIGIKYIVLLILQHQFLNRRIDVTTLRMKAQILDGSNSNIKNDINLDNDRISIYDGLKRVKENPEMEDFCNKYIRREKFEYWFDPKDEIDCEVIHPQLNEDFIKDSE